MTGAQKKRHTTGRQVLLPRNPRLLSTLFAPVAILLKRERSQVLSARHPSRSRKSPSKTPSGNVMPRVKTSSFSSRLSAPVGSLSGASTAFVTNPLKRQTRQAVPLNGHRALVPVSAPSDIQVSFPGPDRLRDPECRTFLRCPQPFHPPVRGTRFPGA